MTEIHAGMKDRTSSNIARDGAPKKIKTSFAVRDGMKDQTKEATGVSPANPGVGPDAAPANPLGKASYAKEYPAPRAAWGMKDATGGSVDHRLGDRVLTEAAKLGR